MQRISDINPLGEERQNISAAARAKLQQERLQRDRDAGYQKLVELCNLGEFDMAKQLADRNYNWGYEIADGMVMERIEFDRM
ncbi:MAG: hypothetical protein ACRC62_16040 [Microcoleus sp.]